MFYFSKERGIGFPPLLEKFVFMKKRLFIFLVIVVSALSAVAQTTITGRIVDARTGEPLPGATLVLKSNEKVGVVTNSDGQFRLQTRVELPLTIIVQFIGYRPQEIDVYDAAEPVDIQLTEVPNYLSEVVVTALGISREKKALGYAAQGIDADALSTGKDNNILNSLEGKLAGVRITNTQGDVGSSRIVIRGETSIAGENQPLFVVDGIPVDNSQLNSQTQGRDPKNTIADLNPDDIQNITVLKGPNAAALYGARAAHGAIVVTTKTGRGSKGLGITVHSSTQLAVATNLPKFQNIFGQGAGGQFSYVNGAGAGVNDGVDESWGPKLDIGLLIPQFDSPLDANGNHTATPWISHPDNVKDYFRTGFTQNTGVAIARSADNFQFRLGFNHEYQRSIVEGSENRKTNASLNVDYDLAKWLSVGATANYIIYTAPNIPGTAGASGSNYRANSTMLQYLWFGRQVDDASLRADWTRNWNASYYSNPYWSANYNTYEQERHRLIGDLHATFHILEGLDLRFRTSTDWYQDRRKGRVKWGTSGTPYGKYEEDAYTVKETNTELTAVYAKKLSEDFSIDALLGWNVRNKQYENNYQAAPRLAVADLYTLTNSRDQLTSSNYFYKLRQYGLYGSVQLAYKDWAFLNVTGRNDWSSTLPKNNNSYFYPSVTASVLLTEALGVKSKVLDFLKLRGGWSQVGSDADPYQLATVFNSETAFNGNPLQTTSGQGKNPDLKPERTTSWEAGLEARLLNDRIRLDFSWYRTDSKDQILQLATTAASGYTTQVRNAGHIRNRGYEIQLGLTPVLTNKFKWDVDINYGHNDNKVIKLDDEGLITSYQLYSSGIQILARVGEAYGTLFGSAYTRNDKGSIVVDDNGLPKVSATSKTLGKFSPNWIGGIQNTFTYKNFTLSFLIDASFGGSIFSNTNKTGRYTGVLENTLPGRDADHGGLWYYKDNGNNVQISQPNYTTTPDGLYYANINGQNTRVFQDGIIVDGVTENGQPNTTVVSAENYYHRLYNIAEANVYDASFVKLRELSIGYNLPKSIYSRLGLQGASVTLTARNLWVIYKKADNIDPEAAITAGNAQGVEAYTLPTARTYGLNINVKF